MQKPNVEAEVYNNNKKCDGEKKGKKKLKRQLDFIMPTKPTTKTEEGKKGKKEKKTQKNLQKSQNMRIINIFPESLLSESFPSLRVTVHLTSLGCSHPMTPGQCVLRQAGPPPLNISRRMPSADARRRSQFQVRK